MPVPFSVFACAYPPPLQFLEEGSSPLLQTGSAEIGSTIDQKSGPFLTQSSRCSRKICSRGFEPTTYRDTSKKENEINRSTTHALFRKGVLLYTPSTQPRPSRHHATTPPRPATPRHAATTKTGPLLDDFLMIFDDQLSRFSTIDRSV